MSSGGGADGIAVVGMDCVFPGAPDLAHFWRNIDGGVDAITEVPPHRWDPVFYDPDADEVDRFYCRRGGFVDGLVDFDAPAFGVMPVAAEGAEPDQLVALQVASRALADAGYDDRPLPRARTGVILGRGNYIGAGMTRLEQHVRTAEQLVSALRDLLPDLPEDRLARVKAEFKSRLGAYGPDTAIGLVPNLTASRIANRLDLGGPAYTVDAACASALLAVERACVDLRAGAVDLALAGGVHLSHDVAFWSVFTQLGALSRSQAIRPFDRNADGLLIGEGVGIVVLKRLAEAVRDDDRIYAVIHGTGVASDGRGATILTPAVAGQRLALERAWEQAGMDPGEVGLVEAHGTATPVGDAAELATLRDFFGPAGPGEQRAVLGSVKSMIGHAMPAAGAAGLIKAALAVYHRRLPPTLHVDEPHPTLAETRFRTLATAEPWQARGRVLAGVNAFGFGGINAHVVLGSHGGAPARRRTEPREQDETLLWLAAPSLDELGRMVDEAIAGPPRSGGAGPCRLALVDPTPTRLARARKAVATGKARRGRDGLWLSPQGLLSRGGKLAFLYPGVEATFRPRVADVAAHFGLPLPPEIEATALERQGAAVTATSLLLTDALAAAGVRPDLAAGHSIGEWTGMIATGLVPPDQVDAFTDTLAPFSLEVPGVVFASVGAGVERVEPLVADLDGVVLSHDNCPHQVVLCGEAEAVEVALVRLREARILAHVLPFRSGFHAPFFADFLAPHQANLARLPLGPPALPLWSATTCAPYPADPDRVRELAARHLVEPVRFRQLVEALYADGVRAFVQVGTGSLVGFVSDTLQGRDHLAISVNEPQRPGMAQLRRVAAALFVEGAPIAWERLDAPAGRPSRARPLALGVPLVRLSTPLGPVLAPPPPPTADPVLQGFAALRRQVDAAAGAVAAAWQARPAAPPQARPAAPPQARAPTQRTTRRLLSVETCPWLLDHSLIPQPPGWPVVADRNPVVPMTMSVRMMLDAATALQPGRVPVAIEGVRATRWLSVEPPVEIELRAAERARDRVEVELGGHVSGTVVLADRWPSPPPPGPPTLPEEAPVGIDAEALYADRWMFHGPAYQAVTRLDALAPDGIRGRLQAMAAEGALLDAAGQLFGFAVMRLVERDRLAMPVKIDRIRFFSPEPGPGTEVDCTVRIRDFGARTVRADMELVVGDRVWALVEGWEDWRFDTDERLWPVMRRTEDHLFAETPAPGLAVVYDPQRSPASRDYLARRFLDARERAALDALPADRRTDRLYALIAAKDALRRWCRDQGMAPLFPVQLHLEGGEAGSRVTIEGPVPADLRVDVAVHGPLAAAVVSLGGRPGVAVEPGDDLAAAERAARRAAARTRGRDGPDPDGVVSKGSDGRLLVGGVELHTLRRGGSVIAWSPP